MMAGSGGGAARGAGVGKGSGKDDIQGLCCMGEKDSAALEGGGGANCARPPIPAELLKPGMMDKASKFMVVY